MSWDILDTKICFCLNSNIHVRIYIQLYNTEIHINYFVVIPLFMLSFYLLYFNCKYNLNIASNHPDIVTEYTLVKYLRRLY